MRTRRVGTMMMLTAIFVGCATVYAVTSQAQPMTPGTQPGMGMQAGQNPTPPVKGLYQGRDLLFIHTEASDPQVAAMLTKMMGPKVIVVPRLAKIPRSLLADVYVFTNGVRGDGPFGFQVDVFDSVPGQARYSPLRSVVLVTWQPGKTPRILGSVEEVRAAVRAGEVTLRRPGVVVNMPIISWPGGQR